jgi:hypothetical protein
MDLAVFGATLLGTMAAMALMAPPQLVQNGNMTVRTLEGANVYQTTRGPDISQQATSYEPAIDAETGLPCFWKHRANGTREQVFADSKGAAHFLPSQL